VIGLRDASGASPVEALSPLDGRYRDAVAPLRAYFSEAALIQARVVVEVAYLEALCEALGRPCSGTEAEALRALMGAFSAADAEEVKRLEGETNHDVKAMEYFLRGRLAAAGLADLAGWVHLGLTSEDVNNLAWGLLTRAARQAVLLPAVAALVAALRDLAAPVVAVPMLARTHGQPATPTTLGKELGVFLARLVEAAEDLEAVPITGKLAGATGTLGALAVAYPHVDWPAFSERFVAGLGLTPVAVVTQIEPHDRLAALFDAARRLCTVVIDLDQDLWRYISDGWLVQRAVAGEVGSSAMPHKVNPIDFENSEGNLGLASALLEHAARKLPVSRLQRDLSDSTVLRNQGVAWGHMLVGLRATVRGLGKLRPHPGRLAAALEAHPEVLAEAYQVALRAAGDAGAYEAFKAVTRGTDVTLADLHAALAATEADSELLARLRALTPAAFIGHAPALAERALAGAEDWLAGRNAP
jgi:adenylosuccinate lyase